MTLKNRVVIELKLIIDPYCGCWEFWFNNIQNEVTVESQKGLADSR